MRNFIIALVFILAFCGCSGRITDAEKAKITIEGQYEIVDIEVGQEHVAKIDSHLFGFSYTPGQILGASSSLANKIKRECLGNVIHLQKFDKAIILSQHGAYAGELTSLLLNTPFSYEWTFDDNYKGKRSSGDYYQVIHGTQVIIGYRHRSMITGEPTTPIYGTDSKKFKIKVPYRRMFWQRLKAPEKLILIGVIKHPTDDMGISYSFYMTLARQ